MTPGGWVYRVVLALSGITLVLVVVYLYLGQQNRAAQAEVNRRQQFINQSIEFNRIDNALIQAIAATAVSANDGKLRDLLSANGVTVNPTTGAHSEQAPPASAPLPAQGK
jgi:hypothetical protein